MLAVPSSLAIRKASRCATDGAGISMRGRDGSAGTDKGFLLWTGAERRMRCTGRAPDNQAQGWDIHVTCPDTRAT
jgi:hypothetical protein